jgi:multidrug efflux pump
MLARNNYLSAVGSTKGSLLQVNLTANTDLHTVDDFKKLVVRQDKGNLVRLSDIADVVLGAEDYNTEVRFSGQKAVFMGIWVLPNANSVDVIKRVRVEMEQIQKELPAGMKAEIAYDATAYINDAIHEVVKTLIDTLLIVMVVIFLFLPHGIGAGSRDPDFAHRRVVSHAGVRFHAKSANASCDRAFGRIGRRRRNRRCRER